MKLRLIAYNASILGGVALLGIGSGLKFGLPVGLMVTGVCMLALTVLMIRVQARA